MLFDVVIINNAEFCQNDRSFNDFGSKRFVLTMLRRLTAISNVLITNQGTSFELVVLNNAFL